MYNLYKLVTGTGLGEVYRRLYSSEDLDKVKEKLCTNVRSGVPVRELTIAKDIPFDFKCAVAIKDEDTLDG